MPTAEFDQPVRHIDVPPPAKAPIMATTDGVGVAAPTESRMQRIVIGAMAPFIEATSNYTITVDQN
jgi:hypothetical protein